MLKLLLLAGVAAAMTPALAQKPAPLLDLYKQIHAHPELSHFEAETSALLAANLRAAGYTVTDHLGLYPDGTHAFGVVGILKNGPGPTLLIRADMDWIEPSTTKLLSRPPRGPHTKEVPGRREKECPSSAMLCP